MTQTESNKKTNISFVSALILIVKGGFVGIANVIPGVSGGTLALILGIFDRLISALKSIGKTTLIVSLKFVFGFWKKDIRTEFFDELKRIDALFLLLLQLGAMIVIVITAKLISFLIQDYTAQTLAFFIGLIIPSISIPLGMMEKKKLPQFFWMFIGVAITVGISLLLQYSSIATALGQSNNVFITSLMLFISGCISISAMILPGLSGSYIVMLAGQYFFLMSMIAGLTDYFASFGKILPAELSIELIILYLFIFTVGCLVGLILFSRLLNFLLKKYHASTMGFLVGLVIGSLFVLWPFKGLPPNPELNDMARKTAKFHLMMETKQAEESLTDDEIKKLIKKRKVKGDYLPKDKWLPAAQNVLPSSSKYRNPIVGGKEDDLYWSLGTLLIGLLLSFGIIRLGKIE